MRTDIPASLTYWITEKDILQNGEVVEDDLPEFQPNNPLLIALPGNGERREDVEDTVEVLEEANTYRAAGQVLIRHRNLDEENLVPLIDIRRALQDREYMDGPEVFNTQFDLVDDNIEDDAEGDSDETINILEENSS